MFRKGDYVKTSQGNIGIIEVPPYNEIGFIGHQSGWYTLGKYSKDDVSNEIESFQWSYPDNRIISIEQKAEVLIDGDIFILGKNHITKLETLSIIPELEFKKKLFVNLSIDDAKLLMDICDRNDIKYLIK